MRPVSDAFLQAVTGSHTAVSYVHVLRDNDFVVQLEVTDGSITLDQTAATRGRLDVTLAELDLVPTDPEAALAPYGNELRAYRGVRYRDGSTEIVSLGIFRIDETSVTDTAEGGVEIRVTGLDRSSRVIDAKFEEPYLLAAGTNIVTAIEDCVRIAIPDLTTSLESTALTTPLLVGEEGGDRWKFVQDLAASLGRSLYFDGDGVLTGQPVTNPSGTPQLTIAEGDGGVLLTAGRRWNRQGTCNRVIATGENAGESAPARGVATDDNPLSPTYYYGQYGKVPRFYSSQILTTDDQAADAATAILSRELGTTQSVDFGAIVNPALEPDDLVQITRLRAGIDEQHVIDAVTIPLTAQQGMTGRTRAVVA